MIDPAALRDLFDRAASLPPTDRASFLAAACGENEPLRQEVERLLAADARLGSVLEARDSVNRSSFGQAADAARALGRGTVLGPYVIDALVGAGGMGEVYRAHDTRLGRTVAIKVLPPALTQDPTARQRFEREARAAASLAHPHICTLLDIGRQGDIDFLVMEYLSGETLAARLRRGCLRLEEALRVADQMANALAAAHRAGIVHRDLKPGNIMLTESGVKLLDFGLARHTEVASADAMTLTAPEPITGTGTILGTLPYMAPEQIEGRSADARTDIFAFGVVLYEMVTGRRAFEAPSHAALIGSILRDDPPSLTTVDPALPLSLERLIHRCLAKEPADRWPTLTHVQARLEALRDLPEDRSGRVVRRPASSRRVRLWIVGVLLLGGVIAATAWWMRRPSGVAPPKPGANVERPSGQRTLTRFTFDRGLQTDPAFSPDGRMLAYTSDRSGNFDIYVQQLAGGDPIQVTKSPAHDTVPSWSPDGNTIAFRSERDGGGIYLVPALGGAERRISSQGTHPSWSADGSELRYVIEPIGNNSTILRAVNVSTGATHDVFEEFQKSGGWNWIATRSDGRVSFLGSRGGRGRSLFTVSDVAVIESDVSAVRSSLQTAYGGQSSIFSEVRFEWNREGDALLLETRSADGIRNLWSVHVDPTTLAWTRMERLTTGSGSFRAGTFSPNGRHVAFSIQQESEPLWEYTISASGLIGGRPATESDASVLGAEISRDGGTILFQLLRPGGTSAPRFWTIRNGGPASEVPGFAGLPWVSLSPDARRVAYLKRRPGSETQLETVALAIHAFDGTDWQLGPWQSGYRTPSDWSRDGKSILTGGHDLRTWPIAGTPARDESHVVVIPTEGNVWEGRYSPNGRWLVFQNSQKRSSPDHATIGVVPLDASPRTPWTLVGADHPWVDKPRWGTDGKTLYFLATDEGAFLDVWRVAFDDVRGVPVGPSIRLSRFDSPAFKLSRSASTTGWGVSGRKAWLTISATAGSIWMLENVDR